MPNEKISAQLNDTQQKIFDEWKDNLRAIFGSYGLLKWTIYSDGIGTYIEVSSSHAPGHPLDLTDENSF